MNRLKTKKFLSLGLFLISLVFITGVTFAVNSVQTEVPQSSETQTTNGQPETNSHAGHSMSETQPTTETSADSTSNSAERAEHSNMIASSQPGVTPVEHRDHTIHVPYTQPEPEDPGHNKCTVGGMGYGYVYRRIAYSSKWHKFFYY